MLREDTNKVKTTWETPAFMQYIFGLNVSDISVRDIGNKIFSPDNHHLSK
jgi:hypothetical protein